nr:inducible metalloproteinase inhibitor protein-like [Aedes albopictus]
MKLKTIVFFTLALPCLAFGSSESSESSEGTRIVSKTCTAPHEIYVPRLLMCPLNCQSWTESIMGVDRAFGRFCINPCHCEKGYIRRESKGPCIPIMECASVRNAVGLFREMVHGMYT